ncbi:class I SAM-dependent methyltransferase [uncultured Shimia sp.]|uniref:class I SAM-dependent methyltransferase n=1 Tax=uncultured Shimia sp. TaxID=573152 RepID=UPI0026175246|nr:class I SAM-dependent methyltransferase [uncultured Shimia sp.]
MTKPSETSAYTSTNRTAWEEVAPIHAKHNQARLIEAFKDPEFSFLDATATKALTSLDVAGKDVAQVCCNNGIELLSVQRMGAARCVGFDGAEGFVEQGRELAEAAGSDAEFVCCDAYDIPAEFHGGFDLAVITIGVLGWMPDIDGFFASIEKLLRPGGAVFIYEHHPILVMVKPGQVGDPFEWELSYFKTDPYVDASGLDYYGGEAYDATPNVSFSHKLSDIFMAAIKGGLAVEHFEELPNHISNTWWNVEHSDIGLPMSYTLVLRKAG